MKKLPTTMTIMAITVRLATPIQAYSTINADRAVNLTSVNACIKGTIEKTKVDYRIAKGYFVKNTIKQPLSDPKIASRQAFDAIFGMAAVMGKDGQPTPIDFDQKYVIAVVVPASDRQVNLTPVRLEKNGEGNLIFTYRKQTGRKQSYTSSAALIILVDKHVTGRIILTEKH